MEEELIFSPVADVVTVDTTGSFPTDLVGNEIYPECLTFPDKEGRCPAAFVYEISDFKNFPEVVLLNFFLEPTEPSKLNLFGNSSMTVEPSSNPEGRVVLQDIRVEGGPQGNLFNATMILIPTFVRIRLLSTTKSRRFPGQTVGSMVTVTREGPKNENVVVVGPPSYLEEIVSLLEVNVDVGTEVGRQQLSITVFASTSSVADDLLRINFAVISSFEEESSFGAIVAVVIGILGIIGIAAAIVFRKHKTSSNEKNKEPLDATKQNAEETEVGVEVDI